MRDWLRFQQRNLLTLLLLFVFVVSLTVIPWGQPIMHPGGGTTLVEILGATLSPNVSPEIISIAVESTFLTLAYAVAGMSIALVIAIILGLTASGILMPSKNPFSSVIQVSSRGALGFLRAIHELIWAWLLVSAFGLTPYAAILAIGIPYGGILGRIFADMLSDVHKEPILALQSAGASRWQVLFYGYLPLVKANLISYTMYRFECAVRSSAVMSFVGLGGLGYQIQLSLHDLHYDEVWTFVYFLIILVILIDSWSSQWRLRMQGTKFAFNRISYIITFFITISSWIYVSTNTPFLELFSDRNLQYVKKFLLNLLGLTEEQPAFLSLTSWENVLRQTYDTLMMSILAIGLSTFVMILTVLPGARNIANGQLSQGPKWYSWLLFGVIRICFVVSRAVPELVWAMIIIFVFKPGLLPGALALALHNFGILGKLCAEVIEELDERPLHNLVSSGANFAQILLYGVIPSVYAQFLSYILYRFEVIMRTTVVVGFVGAGGLGLQFKLSMSYFHYSDITLLLICYLLLVWFADLLSESSRKFVK